jgi:hypothetical protein
MTLDEELLEKAAMEIEPWAWKVDAVQNYGSLFVAARSDLARRQARAAITAYLDAAVESRKAKYGRAYLFAWDHDAWQADSDIEPIDNDEFPVLILKVTP